MARGFVCPRCNTQSAWGTSRNLQVCTKCQYQGSVTVGTIFQDTRKPLPLWFGAIWWVTTQKNGERLRCAMDSGTGSYTTAWIWLHKLRRAMVRPGRDRLSGRVEAVTSSLSRLIPQTSFQDHMHRWVAARCEFAIFGELRREK
jgi:ribosomal protein S27AE